VKAFAKVTFVSLLDLMCCGFGGALLIFLIVLSADPTGARENPLLVVRCRHIGTGPRAEVGLKYKGPTDAQWQRARLVPASKESAGANSTESNSPDNTLLFFFSATSAAGSGSETCLVLVRPVSGVWEFRPYLVDYPSSATAEPVHVELEVFGQAIDGVPEIEGRGRPMRHPGHDEGPLLRVGVRSAGNGVP
jgi:hypothetical protein